MVTQGEELQGNIKNKSQQGQKSIYPQVFLMTLFLFKII